MEGIMTGNSRTLVSALRKRVESTPDTLAFTFDADGRSEPVTFEQLYERALAVCSQVQSVCGRGDRALLVYAPSIDYVVAFYGCLMAGVIAVPVYPPDGARFEAAIEKIAAIGRDCEPSAILTVGEIAEAKGHLSHLVGGLSDISWVATDGQHTGRGSRAVIADVTEEDIALLQYSSGSTGDPKGVVLRHRNLANNLMIIGEKFELRADDSAVIWLPPYHDMGLIGGVLAPIWHGLTVHLSSPFDFLKDPSSWLRKISETGATASGGPNFAYELCAQRVTADDSSQLDLSRWRIAFTGAEPIRPSTLERFAERFSSNGFDHRSWYPCYGLAEATLLVAGGVPGDGAAVTAFDRGRLAMGEALPDAAGQKVVSCGTSHVDQHLRIVVPGSVDVLNGDRVGEILVSGASADTGYWSGGAHTDANWSTLEGRQYLRTGDLGFLHNGRLHVTGRLKDVLIRAGRNYYPQDLEHLTESVAGVRAGASVAIETLVGGNSVVTVAAELLDLDISRTQQHAIATDISERCVRGAGLSVERVLLLPRNSILKTSSGKVRRQPTAAAIDGGHIACIYDNAGNLSEATEPGMTVPPGSSDTGAESSSEQTPARVHAAVVVALADAGVLIPAEGQKVHMDSLQALTVTHRIGEKYPPGPDLAILLSGCRLEQITASAVDRQKPVHKPSVVLPGSDTVVQNDELQVVPCTPNQTAMLHSVHMGNDPSAGVLARAVHSAAAWNLQEVTSVLADLVIEQPALQVGIEQTPAGDYVQVFSPDLPQIGVEEFDLCDLDSEEALAQISEWAHAPFDLSCAPLMRAAHMRVADGFVFAIAIHHVVADNTSVIGTLERLLGFSRLALPSAAPRDDRRRQYVQFCREQEKAVRQANRSALAGAITRMSPGLPLYQFPLSDANCKAGVVNGDLSGLAGDVRRAAGELETTPFVVWLSLIEGCLLRMSTQDALAIGVPLVHRPDGDDILGYAVHPQVVRADIDAATTFADLVNNNKLEQIRILTGGPVGIADLASSVGGTRVRGRNPLFDILFTYQSWRDGSAIEHLLAECPEANQLNIGPLPMGRGTTGLPLNCALSASAEAAHLRLEFDGAVASRGFAVCLLSALQTFASEALAHFDLPLVSLGLSNPREQDDLVRMGQGSPVSASGGIVSAISAHASSDNDRVAVRSLSSPPMSYGTLWQVSGSVAAALQHRGIKRGQLVGAHFERTPEMVAALLGIMRAGAAYVPLDPHYPDARTRQVVAASGLSLVLTNADTDSLPHGQFEPTDTMTLAEALAYDPTAAVSTPEPGPTDTAYVLFTSGSTGEPKGVEISHANVANLSAWAGNVFGLDREVVLASTSICFDLSVFEIFATLAAGGEIALAENATHAIGRLNELGVTLINTVPSAMDGLLSRGIPSTVRTVCLAGEPLSARLVARVIERCPPGTRVFNLYGPSETTTYSTFDEVVGGGAVTIGRPVANTQVYVVDERLRPVPVGVCGELLIGGAGVARGYFGRDDLTAERFVPDTLGGGEGRLYRTGDVVRFRADGRLDYVGRADHQVKVRGFRVELGDIEAAAQGDDRVSQVVCVAVGDGADRAVAAYLVPSELGGDREALVAGVRERCRRSLPDYMVPSTWVVLDALPLTPNGKIDRAGLPDHREFAIRSTSDYIGPRTATERLVVELWQQMLDVEQVGIHDNFFDLGGNSLHAQHLIAQIQDRSGRDVTLRQFVNCPTPAGIALEIDDAAHRPASIQPAIRRLAR
jgi:amino acid adenylation domain-containing protein